MSRTAILAALAVSTISAAAHADVQPDPFHLLATGFDSTILSTAPQDGRAGVFVMTPAGVFWNYTVDTVGGSIGAQKLPGNPAVSGRGIKAIRSGNDLYLFEVEQNGLWYIRIPPAGGFWGSWCQVDPRQDLASAPAAVSPGGGSPVVFVRTTSSRLLQWRVPVSPTTCTTLQPSQDMGTTTTDPVATTWGYGRYDTFGRGPTGDLVHWWSNNGGASFLSEDTFGGQRVALYNGTRDLAAISRGVNSLDVFVRVSGVRLSHVIYHGAWVVDLLGGANTFDADMGMGQQKGYDAAVLHGFSNGSLLYGMSSYDSNNYFTSTAYAIPEIAGVARALNLGNSVSGFVHHVFFVSPSSQRLYWARITDGP